MERLEPQVFINYVTECRSVAACVYVYPVEMAAVESAKSLSSFLSVLITSLVSLSAVVICLAFNPLALMLSNYVSLFSMVFKL